MFGYRNTRASGLTWIQLLILIIILILIILGIWKCSPSTPKYSGPTMVRGFIAVSVGAQPGIAAGSLTAEVIELPAIQVVLREAGTSNDSDPSITDLSGRFTTLVKKPGKYEVCWKGEGFGNGCLPKSIDVKDRFDDVGTVLIPLPTGKDTVAIYGTVRLADGTTPRAFDSLANINAFARIGFMDMKGIPQLEVAINNHDKYVLTGVQPGQEYRLRIHEEKYDNTQGLMLSNGVPTQRFDFTMRNSSPVIEPLFARDTNGVRVAVAAAGSAVKLITRASDRDGDKIDYFWRVSGGTLSSATDASPTWTLPTSTGKHAATLIAYDSRGGYSSQSIAVTVDPRGLEFSGLVTGTDAPALAGANVDVNGVPAITDANGRFRLFVPDKQRFVMNIRKQGYGLASIVAYDAVVGGTWQLVRASVASVDPKLDIAVTNKRERSDCPGTPSDRMDWAGHPELAKPRFQDGKGNFVGMPKDIGLLPGLPLQPGKTDSQTVGCGPGISVKIPANSLVDSSGNAPVGMVNVQLSTIDLRSPNQMPGNYTVEQSARSVGVMQSYGAGIVEIYSGTTQYNLKTGAKAQLVIPVDATQIAAGGTLPATIPLLHYLEDKGVWKQDGTLTLTTVSGVKAYVSDVTHFTAYNSDLIKTDQSCISLQNQNMPASYDLEVTIPITGAAPIKRLFTGVTGGNLENVLLNLPKLTNIVLVPIRTTDADPNKNQLPMGVFVVNSGQPQNPNWPTVPGGFVNEPQGPPYYTVDSGGHPNGACSTKVILKDLGLSFYSDPSQLLTGAFLHGLGSFAAINLSDTYPAFAADVNQALRDGVEAASAAYRAAIDPRGLRTSLACFKVANGFPLKASDSCPAVAGFTPPAVLPETTAVYANTIDLGFGREMHCVKNGASTACYVSNYDSLVYTGPGSGTDVSKAEHAVEGFLGAGASPPTPDATVAMEYSQLEDPAAAGSPVTTSDPERVVKFFVFSGAGTPLDKANLDGLGARPVPQLCMVCHGGFIPNPNGSTQTASGVKTPVFRDPAVDGAGSRADVKLNAKYLPFDLKSLSYSTNAAFTQPAQEGAFKTLNDIVKVSPAPDASDPSSNDISVLIDTWYPGNVIPQQNVAVPLWNATPQQSAMYVNVIGRACRTCHITNPTPALRFDREVASSGVLGFEDALANVQQRVCKQHVMPHARRTHDLFWTSTSPSQPAQLQAYGDAVKTANPSVGWTIATSSSDIFCGNEYTQGGGVIVTNTAFSPVSSIFTSNCTGCHNDGAAASAGVAKLGLDTDAYAHIVAVDAWELTSMKRIGTNTGNSYLYRKLEGTHTGLGSYQSPGPGVQMPKNAPNLSPADMTTISSWIAGGAQP